MSTLLKRISQVGLLYLLSLLVNHSLSYFKIPLPGSLVGIILLFLLLKSRIVRLEWIETGANWLLAELLLFFIPSAVGIIQYRSLLAADGVSLVLILVVSTAIVMTSAGLLVEHISKYKEEKARC